MFTLTNVDEFTETTSDAAQEVRNSATAALF